MPIDNKVAVLVEITPTKEAQINFLDALQKTGIKQATYLGMNESTKRREFRETSLYRILVPEYQSENIQNTLIKYDFVVSVILDTFRGRNPLYCP